MSQNALAEKMSGSLTIAKFWQVTDAAAAGTPLRDELVATMV